MCQGPDTEHVEIETCDEQVPDKVSSSHRLDHGAGARVAPNALLPVHIPTFVVNENNPDSKAVDEAALDHGYDMSIPVETLLPREFRVVVASQKCGYDRGDGPKDDGVQKSGRQDFMNMQGQRRQVQPLTPWSHKLGQPWDRGDHKGILHVGGSRRFLWPVSVAIRTPYP